MTKNSATHENASRDQSPAGPVIFVPYDPKWAANYGRTKKEIERALRSVGLSKIISGIEHIGSTAVHGLSGKPRIDVMVGVRSVEHITRFPDSTLERLGFVRVPFFNPKVAETRKLFTRQSPAANIHVFAYKGELWRDHLVVRDYLRVHPRVATSYERLKSVLAVKYASNPRAYGRAKSDFVEVLQSRALKWRYKLSNRGQVSTGAGRSPAPFNRRRRHSRLYVNWPDGWTVGLWYLPG